MTRRKSNMSKIITLYKSADKDRLAAWAKAERGDWDGFEGLIACANASNAEAKMLEAKR